MPRLIGRLRPPEAASQDNPSFTLDPRDRSASEPLCLTAVRRSVGDPPIAVAVSLSVGQHPAVVASRATGRTLGHLLYGVSPQDPGTFSAGAALVTTAAVGVCYLAARRVFHLDLLGLLRAE